jgi:hypothetical protein
MLIVRDWFPVRAGRRSRPQILDYLQRNSDGTCVPTVGRCTTITPHMTVCDPCLLQKWNGSVRCRCPAWSTVGHCERICK